MSPGELMRALIDETNILQELKLENTMESLARRENIQEFLSAITDHFHEKPEATLESFLEEVALFSEADNVDGTKNSVTLMTLHAAKGLEFQVVCITGLEEGLFPSQSSSDDARDLEEERRLLYVGITRAKKKCFLYYAMARLRFGETVRELPSRFIEELQRSDSTERVTSFGTKPRERERASDQQRESSYLLSGSPVVNGRTFTRKRREGGPASRSGNAAAYHIDAESPTNYSQVEGEFHRGTRVFHETFGEGRVLEIVGRGEKAKATVDFAKFGRKNLMLQYANLKVL